MKRSSASTSFSTSISTIFLVLFIAIIIADYLAVCAEAVKTDIFDLLGKSRQDEVEVNGSFFETLQSDIDYYSHLKDASGRNLLHVACLNGLTDTVKRLILDYNFNISALDKDENSPLIYATSKSNSWTANRQRMTLSLGGLLRNVKLRWSVKRVK